MKTLAEIYEKHRTTGGDVGHGDKGSTHSYIEHYDKLLSKYRTGCVLMEIGIAYGLSLSMWREFMPSSTIIGVDVSIVFNTADHIASGTKIIEADATKPEFLNKIGGIMFDVVIDDASHNFDDQVATFKMLRHNMSQGGIYIIEDVIDLDATKNLWPTLHANCEIRDLRSVKGYFADVLVIYRF